MYTGTLIEDLFATVERAEERAQAGNLAKIEIAKFEPWLTVQENTNYDLKAIGAA